MPLPQNPLLFAFPLFRLGQGFNLLGCGFFVGADGTFLTARHVLPTPPLQPGERLVAGLIRDDAPRIVDVDPASLRASRQFDVASGRIETSLPLVPLEIAEACPPSNIDLLCVEFSRTHAVEHPGGPSEMRFYPVNHRGYLVSQTSERVAGVESLVIEVSFPALRGASGSAVVDSVSGKVVGMLVGNMAHHLLPAQVERVEGPQGEVEELRYYLPYGLALSWEHLREFLEI